MATLPTRTLCDQLVTELTNAQTPGADDSYARAYFADTADVEDTARKLTAGGRRVTICPSLPLAYSYEPFTRGRDKYTHRISVLVEKRLASATTGGWTRALIDTEVDWVYTNIVALFDYDNRSTAATASFNKLLTTLSADVQLFDLDDLLSHGALFTSQVDLVFEELVDV